jgi:hypothetical protein
MFDLLLKNFPSQDEFFYAPFGGVGVDCALLGAARDLGWVAWEGDGAPLRLCTAVARANATGVYRTPRGTRAIVKARDFALPRYLQRNPQLLDRPEWLSCGGRRDVSYNLFSGAAFSHHVYVEPVLDAYDVTFKMDVDVRFLRLPPFDPLAALAGCSIMVTRVFPWEICNTNSVEAFTKFAELTGRPASSAGREWLRVGDFTYGMFHADVSQAMRAPFFTPGCTSAWRTATFGTAGAIRRPGRSSPPCGGTWGTTCATAARCACGPGRSGPARTERARGPLC